MNCNPCCGCFPPITTYNPSAADNFPTILQQVEYLKALLKKYPSQQWFITQEKVTEETKSLNKLSILSNGREPQGGDFILGNKENGTTLLFQYTGVITEYVNYNLIYVGVFTNQDLAEEALAKAQDALNLAQTNEQDKVDKVEKGELTRIYAVLVSGIQTFLETSKTALPHKVPQYDENGDLHTAGISNEETVVPNNAYIEKFYQPLLSRFSKFNFGGKTVKQPKSNGHMVVEEELATLFGNKPLTNGGNIDLYKHHIDIAGTSGNYQIGKTSAAHVEAFIEFYASNNLKVDSLTDLKTLLGNTFMIGCKGIGWDNTIDKPIILDYMDENNLHYITDSFNYNTIPISVITFTDTVTTI